MEWALIILISISGHGIREYVHPMPSFDVCQQTLLITKIHVSQGDENEQSVVAYCAGSTV